jgi:hypothetical protein
VKQQKAPKTATKQVLTPQMRRMTKTNGTLNKQVSRN